MTDHSSPNAEQVRYWSEDAGPRWAAPDLQARLLDALRAFLAAHLGEPGVILPGAIWIVTARW